MPVVVVAVAAAMLVALLAEAAAAVVTPAVVPVVLSALMVQLPTLTATPVNRGTLTILGVAACTTLPALLPLGNAALVVVATEKQETRLMMHAYKIERRLTPCKTSTL